MGRKRASTLTPRPDRISASELKHWMVANGISINQLSVALSSKPGFGSCKYRTVEGWLLEYRHCPAWLEHRINFVADHGGKLPRYGRRWPVETQPETPFPIAPATCEHCGAPLNPDGDCSFDFCPSRDDDE